MKRPIILTLVHYYLPGYKSGGPIRTIANMVDQLGDELDFRIVTSDRDALDETAYPGISVDHWNSVGKAQVLYLSPANRRMETLTRIIQDTPHDILYLNSFFDRVCTLRPLLARRMGRLPDSPTVIAPRGEFSTGALALKQWKKAPYLRAAKVLGIYRDLTWQASSDREVEDIQRMIGRVARAIVVAPNLPSTTSPEVPFRPRVPGEPLKIIFLSRVSPMKNLDFALRVLAEVRVPVEFNIYGPIRDEEYWKRCKEQAKYLPEHIQLHYHGMKPHSDVPQTLAGHDLFFLPTRGENYGHAIVEAWAAGLPVLISDETPWRGLEALGVGWDLPLIDVGAFVSVIETLSRQEGEACHAVRERAVRHANAISTDQACVDDNLSLFLQLIEPAGEG